ncbi:MAG: NAD(+) diphosphatase [Sphingomonas sp.]|uniref:NAD(+) diphosphatase n=1 Tax=Sphingomonas sp. TaxID=28214 RepID=UPI001AC56F4D|nr:NAD(+) diphosphatase [Sphingomonas sp.]MBN8809011.1 NAD(+) diphosphatase [Sphingomonas sp.]
MTSATPRPGFTGSPLDRADAIRHDPDALAAAMGDWRARLLVLNDFEPAVGADGTLGWTSLADAPLDAELVLLGLIDGKPHFAAYIDGMRAPPGRSPNLFRALDLLRPGEAGTYAAARSILDWHSRHRFCANCGQPTAMIRAGWARLCNACGTEHFPRTDPVVIMIADHAGRALVGRGPQWPAGRYSALAGFMEPGESIEEAVAREIWEEAGIRVHTVRYVVSQPWPFPSQLMMACIAQAEDDALTIDPKELQDAIWVSRDDVKKALAGDPSAPFLSPPHYAIAHTLLTVWANEE